MKLAIVSPCYNEEEMLPISIKRLTLLLDSLKAKGLADAESYVLFVDDGSKDKTWQTICEAHKTDSRFCGIKLRENTGHQNALMAGLMTVKDKCDASVSVDADLQDDIENAIPEMIHRYNEGYHIVCGVKVSRQADSAAKRITADLFYKFQKLAGMKIIYNHADFRLMSNDALKQLSKYKETNLYLRGIITTLGYECATVAESISKREVGESKYTLSKMFSLAFNGLTSFSIRTVSVIMIIGMIVLGTGIIIALGSICYIIAKHTVSTEMLILISIWLLSGFIIIAIALIGKYIDKIYSAINGRTAYEIEEILIK